MSEENQHHDNQQNTGVSLEQLQKELNSALAGWKRTAADFENFRRRKEDENKELVEFAREVTVAKLLPTLDSLEQAFKHFPELNEESGAVNPEFAQQYKNWQIGINGIVIQLAKVLEEVGVKKIQALGTQFDPHLHEAVREEENEKVPGTVIDELQIGFELNGKVIRPSQVVISKGN